MIRNRFVITSSILIFVVLILPALVLLESDLDVDSSSTYEKKSYAEISETLYSVSWNISIVEETSGEWHQTALEFDKNDVPHVVYYPPGEIRYAKWNGSAWEIVTVATTGVGGADMDMTLNSSGLPHIVYNDINSFEYAFWNGTDWKLEIISDVDVTYLCSIVIDTQDHLHVAYLMWENNTVYYATRNESGWNSEFIGQVGTPGFGFGSVSIAVNSSDVPYIAYYNASGGNVTYATRSPSGWQSEVIDNGGIINFGWKGISLKFDQFDNPHITYLSLIESGIKYASKANDTWKIELVDVPINFTTYLSMDLDVLGRPHIAYSDYVNNESKLGYANYCCDKWVESVVENGSLVGRFNSIATNSTGVPHITYSEGISWSGVKFAAGTLKPDLSVLPNDIKLSHSSPVMNNTLVTISAPIHNIDCKNASNVVVRFYDGDPGEPPGSGPGILIDVDQVIPWIPSGENRTASVQWAATPTQIHDTYVVVDPDNNIAESNETNNIASTTIEVSNPDYILWNKPPPQQTVSIGNSVQISTQVKNVGNINATIESTITFYNQSTPLSPFAAHLVPSLNASEVSIEYDAMWYAPTISGTYYVVIEVDYNNDIDELNEGNNTYLIKFNVTDKPITTIHVGTPQYGAIPRYVNSSTQFWFSIVDPSGTGYNTFYYVDVPPWILYAGPFNISSEGAHTIYYNSTDNLGGVEDTQVFEIIVDNTPPTTSISPDNQEVQVGTAFTLIAIDMGSGVNFTQYSIDDGNWINYSGPFSIETYGQHVIKYRSVDNLGNIESVKTLSINIPTSQPPEPEEYNWKPIIALVFAIILLLIGSLVALKRPFKFKEDLKKNKIFTWMIFVLPFVIAEIWTGVFSALTGHLSIPPLLGPGMVVDLAILATGLVVSLGLYMKMGRK